MKLETANKGNYKGLYGEIVTLDCYKLKELTFVPDTIIDLGANVGIFTRYARELFPNAFIVAVEPDPENFEYLKIDNDHPKTILINKAIGKGNIYRIPMALNGAHECYLSEGIGYNEEDLKYLSATNVESLMLPDLRPYITGKVLLKVDIEGNDMVILNDPESVSLMQTFDYLAFELHYFAQTHEKVLKIREKVKEVIALISQTHKVTLDLPYFFATKL